MATTIEYTVECPNCGFTQPELIEDLDGDATCDNCETLLGVVVRIEGFERVPAHSRK